jgi:biotin transport system substrate-specific component
LVLACPLLHGDCHVFSREFTAARGPGTLSDAALYERGFVQTAALICTGAGLIAAAAQISIPLPFTPVPITGQTFAVLLVGAGLGAGRGATSAILYLALGLTHAPVFAHGTQGLDAVTGASGGYLVSFPFAAALAGWFAERRWDRRFSSAIGAMLTANVVIYAVGIPWLALSLHTSFRHALELGLYPFVPGDLLKLYLAAAALPATWRMVSGATPDALAHKPPNSNSET